VTTPCHLDDACDAVRLPKFFIYGSVGGGQSSSSNNMVHAHGGNLVGL